MIIKKKHEVMREKKIKKIDSYSFKRKEMIWFLYNRKKK